MGRRLAAALLCTLVVITAAPATAVNLEESRIAQAREDLQSVRLELDDARSTADTDQIALEDADRQLQAAFDAVQAASQAAGRQQDAVADAEARLLDARAELQAQRELMADRVARLYRQARPDPLIAALDASSVTQAVQQSAYMSAIGREDRAAMEALANAETTVAAEEQALEAENVSLDRVLGEQRLVLAEVEEIRGDRALVAAASDELVAELQSRESYLASEEADATRVAAQAQELAAAAAEQVTRLQAIAPAGAAASTADDDAAATPAEADEEGVATEVEAVEDAAAEEEAVEDAAAEEEPEEDAEEAEQAEEAVAAAPAPSGGGFSWPTSGSVTSGFGERWGRQHAGIDIASSPGTAVAAARGGTVASAGTEGGYGNSVVIAHGDGFATRYAHLESIAVSAGQSVSTGTYLGGMGCSGSCTGTHLHFEIRINGAAVDPMGYL